MEESSPPVDVGAANNAAGATSSGAALLAAGCVGADGDAAGRFHDVALVLVL